MTVYNLNEILPQGAGDLRQGFSGATDDRAFNAIDMSLNGGSIGAAHGVEAQWSEIGHKLVRVLPCSIRRISLLRVLVNRENGKRGLSALLPAPRLRRGKHDPTIDKAKAESRKGFCMSGRCLPQCAQLRAHKCPCEGGVALGTGLTSMWIPVGLLALIGLFMIFQFIGERRQNAEIEREEAEAAAKAKAAAMAATSEPAAEPAAEASVAKEAAAPVVTQPLPTQEVIRLAPETVRKKFRPFRRTAWIWFPFLVGFATQGYLDYGRQYVDLGQAYNDYLKPIVAKYLG